MEQQLAERLELRDHILNRIDEIIRDCDEKSRPLEMEPWRGQLFELFVMAEGTGCLAEESEPDLSADGVCQALAERWGLKSAAQNWGQANGQVPPEQMAKMRSLWSVLRMWMEWTYAWKRWPEFHETEKPAVD